MFEKINNVTIRIKKLKKNGLPQMNRISFFTPVCYQDRHQSSKEFLLEKIDSYFYLGGKKAQVIRSENRSSTKEVILIDSHASMFITAAKIASYVIIILPLVMLAAKALLRSNYDFVLKDKTSAVPHSPITEDFLNKKDRNTPKDFLPLEPTVTSLEASRVNFQEEPTCPLTLQPFMRPWILLEDGFTYEKSAIEKWLELHPNNSPLIGEIRSATLLPNRTMNKFNSICPITQEPFQEPYYCVEDGQTYEKDAILKWFEVKRVENLQQETFPIKTIKSPTTGIALTSLTLYPNKILFREGIPETQEPIIFKINYETINKTKRNSVTCIFDDEIRELITTYLNETDYATKQELYKKINARRIHLGLKNIKNTVFPNNIDLSHLNLSRMNLNGLEQKGAILKETDLSDSLLTNCNFARCRFINCNMQRAVFVDCTFIGEEVSFFQTDMKDATIGQNCHIEKGTTWRVITNWSEFKNELQSRGAINSDSIILSPLSHVSRYSLSEAQ